MSKFKSDWVERNIVYKRIGGADASPHYKQVERPVIVVLCGSSRFKEQFDLANYRETMAGKIVLSIGFAGHRQKFVDGYLVDMPHGEQFGCTAEQKVELDKLHKRKIELADEVLIISVGGYVGSSTRSEIDHAVKLGKTVRWMEESAEKNYLEGAR